MTDPVAAKIRLAGGMERRVGLECRRVGAAGARRPLVVLVRNLPVECERTVRVDVVRVQDGVVRIVEALVADPGGHRQLRGDEPLVLQEERELLLGEGGGARLVGRPAVQAAELLILYPSASEERRLIVSGEEIDSP